MLRIGPTLGPTLGAVAVAAGPGAAVTITQRTARPERQRESGSYAGQRAFTNTADTVHHFEWDGRRWVYLGRWRLGDPHA